MDWHKHFAEVSRGERDNGSRFGAETIAAPITSVSVAKVVGIDKLTPGQLVSLNNAAKTIGIPVDWLATVISFETGGTFSTTVDNKAGSGAFGLIQFMPATAQAILKTSTREDAIKQGKAMSFDQQLQKMVVPYFSSYKSKLKSLNDVYLAVFYPAAMAKPDRHVVAEAPSAVYRQNAGFDRENRGYITRADITSTVTRILNNASSLPRITITKGAVWPQVIAGLGVAAGVTYILSQTTELAPFIPKRV